MRPVLVLRPEPGNTATCRAARAIGLDAIAAPLSVYAPRAWSSPDADWHGLLIGSAAVFAHGGPELAALRGRPVHAVGQATARAAIAAGFAVASVGSGGLQSVVASLPAGRYLRLTGAVHVPLDLPAGVMVTDVVVYAADPAPLRPEITALLRGKATLALLHSAEAARHFVQQCAAHDVPRQSIALACLAPRIAAAAGENWQVLEIAQSPDDEALLSLAQQMCQTMLHQGNGQSEK